MNAGPRFLEVDEVLRLHADGLADHGGAAGIRDRGLLDSAVAMPRAAFSGEFLHSDLQEMAAAYLFHLVKNHPFLDGNKRVGAAAAVVFLELNRLRFSGTNDELAELVLATARGELEKPAIAEFFRQHSKPAVERKRRRRRT